MKNPDENCIIYRPSDYYLRKQIRTEREIEALRLVALELVTELEMHKAFIRENGFQPPKSAVTVDEAEAKCLS